MPDQHVFSMPYTILVGDLNYGRHVGGDAIVRILHESRLRFLSFLGTFSENSISSNIGLIMLSLDLKFKQQLFHGDSIHIDLQVSALKKTRWTLDYYIYKQEDVSLCHQASTSFTFFNYLEQKLSQGPENFLKILENYQKTTSLGRANLNG